MTGTRDNHAIALLIGICLLVTDPRSALAADEGDRIDESIRVIEEIMAAPDSAVPEAILDNAVAIAVFPSTIKAGFIFGGHRGRGFIAARHPDTGAWSPPAFLTLAGGSFGLQIGGQAVDLILVVRNRRGLEQLLENEFKIGGDATAVVGPVGRHAEASTDIQLRAEILSYSRTRGIFAGITLQGSTIRADRDANERFYGERFDSTEVVIDGEVEPSSMPDAVERLQTTLATLAPPRQ